MRVSDTTESAFGQERHPLHPALKPFDQNNKRLQENVHPIDWKNPTPAGCYNLVVIGAGTAGLVTAIGASSLGAKVAIVEKDLMGGDCLNVGCVPSKTVIKSARIMAKIRSAKNFGINGLDQVHVDFSEVMQRMRQVRASISPVDSAKRFSEAGVDVFFGSAGFVDDRHIAVGQQKLKFKKAVIATGARAVVPPINGLSSVPYLTNETVFSLIERPEHLIVIGAGPIGCELAQAFCRLGSKVSIIEKGNQFLAREDADAAQLLLESLRRDGVQVYIGAETKNVRAENSTKYVEIDQGGESKTLQGDQILVAVGRAPNLEGLNLENVGVKYDPRRGVDVNDKLQTSNKRIYAAGDICSRYKFTHTADFSARTVIGNALFLPFGKISRMVIPWCTYTEPELAHVGLYERDAKAQGIAIETFTVPFSDVDRAIADGDTEGFVRVHVKKGSDKIVGATIVGSHAGDMISEITLAITNKIGLTKVASTIHPYPTRAEAIRKVGDAYNRTRLTPRVKSIMAAWLRFLRG